jgi:hypothetical protein
MASSTGAIRGAISLITHSAKPTIACKTSAIATAVSDMRSKRDDEMLGAWVTEGAARASC